MKEAGGEIIKIGLSEVPSIVQGAPLGGKEECPKMATDWGPILLLIASQ